jgi:hypothetical protein
VGISIRKGKRRLEEAEKDMGNHQKQGLLLLRRLYEQGTI